MWGMEEDGVYVLQLLRRPGTLGVQKLLEGRFSFRGGKVLNIDQKNQSLSYTDIFVG